MTEDQLVLIKKRLNEYGFLEVVFKPSCIKCLVVVNNYKIYLECMLSCFPYKFPKIFIDESSYKKFYPLPHLNEDRSLCTFDVSTVIPNFYEPLELIIATFLKAQEILYNGITKVNFSDFQEEFNAYWNLEDLQKVDSIISVTDIPHNICIVESKVLKKHFIADNKYEIIKFVSNIDGVYVKDLKIEKGLYIPLNINMIPPFSYSDFDVFKLVKKDNTSFDIYNDFLNINCENGPYIAFSIKFKEKRFLQMWKHNYVINNSKGFRRGKAPVEILYRRNSYSRKIIKFFVTDMTQNRLFFRGGININTGLNKVAMIGCGSVGSYMVEALAEYSVKDFLLVDSECLTSENIARHFCGYAFIGKTKADSIKTKLNKHNPNVNCKTYNDDAFHFFENNLDIINNYDIIFSATASLPLEAKIISLFNENKIKKPIILIWGEPFLAAGHAIIINKKQDILNKLFDENLFFKKAVVKNGSQFFKREAGCQSTFVQYAAFSLKQFIYSFLNYLIYENIKKNKKENYLFTWLGNMDEAKNLGCEISSEWDDLDNFSFWVERIN